MAFQINKVTEKARKLEESDGFMVAGRYVRDQVREENARNKGKEVDRWAVAVPCFRKPQEAESTSGKPIPTGLVVLQRKHSNKTASVRMTLGEVMEGIDEKLSFSVATSASDIPEVLHDVLGSEGWLEFAEGCDVVTTEKPDVEASLEEKVSEVREAISGNPNQRIIPLVKTTVPGRSGKHVVTYCMMQRTHRGAKVATVKLVLGDTMATPMEVGDEIILAEHSNMLTEDALWALMIADWVELGFYDHVKAFKRFAGKYRLKKGEARCDSAFLTWHDEVRGVPTWAVRYKFHRGTDGRNFVQLLSGMRVQEITLESGELGEVRVVTNYEKDEPLLVDRKELEQKFPELIQALEFNGQLERERKPVTAEDWVKKNSGGGAHRYIFKIGDAAVCLVRVKRKVQGASRWFAIVRETFNNPDGFSRNESWELDTEALMKKDLSLYTRLCGIGWL